jgi:hypothetical protein
MASTAEGANPILRQIVDALAARWQYRGNTVASGRQSGAAGLLTDLDPTSTAPVLRPTTHPTGS